MRTKPLIFYGYLLILGWQPLMFCGHKKIIVAGKKMAVSPNKINLSPSVSSTKKIIIIPKRQVVRKKIFNMNIFQDYAKKLKSALFNKLQWFVIYSLVNISHYKNQLLGGIFVAFASTLFPTVGSSPVSTRDMEIHMSTLNLNQDNEDIVDLAKAKS